MAQKMFIQVDLDPKGMVVGAEVVKRALDDTARKGEQAHRRMGAAAGFSGEKLAKFGTVSLALTGTMNRVGVSGDALAKTFSVVGDLALGAINPIYLVVGALGAAASAVALFIGRQKAEREAIERTNDALFKQIEYNRVLAAQGDPLARRSLVDTEAAARQQIADAERRRAGIEQERAGGRLSWYQRTFGVGGMYPDPIMVLPEGGRLRKMKEDAQEATDKIREANSALLALFGTDTAGPMPEDPMARYAREWDEFQQRQRDAQREAETQAEAERRFRIGSMGRIVDQRGILSWPDDLSPRGTGAQDRGELFGIRRANNDMLNATIKIIPDKGAEIVQAWRENVVDPMQQSLANGIYGAFQAGKRGVDELGSYMLDYFTNNILKALSEKIAMSLAGSLAGGGGFISALFTGSFGGDKDLGGAKSMNLEWRRARG